MIKRVAIIGAGNVATHLGNALKNVGIEIVCISSKHPENAAKLAEQTGAKSYGRVEDVSYDGADAIIVSVKDDSITDVLSQLPQNNAILIHTSGGVPADILAGKSERYGIIYPLQTFTKNRELDFSEIPLFIEAGDTATLPIFRPLIGFDKDEIMALAQKIGTYDTSILPYEDCCTVFLPKSPAIKPALESVRRAESVLDIDALIENAVNGAERL